MAPRLKRARGRSRMYLPGSEFDYPDKDPPPFAPAQLALQKAYRQPLPRSVSRGTAPPYVSLVLMAGQRLRARDFSSAATVLPVLFRRFRQIKNRRWFFTREIAVTGAEVLRRVAWKGHLELLDDFLAQISRDRHLSGHVGCEGYSSRTRESALLERALELIAAGKLKQAYECLYEQIQDAAFRDSALVQGYLGIVALAISVKEDNPSALLRTAAGALKIASEIEPTAYFYVYYAAAAAMAAGMREEALALLRNFIEERNRNDPIALYGVLSCLQGLETREATDIRQERVDIARRLLTVDPLALAGLNILREAHTWDWDVQPKVDRVEMAEVLGSRIEHGDVADSANWTALAHVLSWCSNERHVFWELSGRAQWWPTHFFRVTRLNADIATNPKLAAAKSAVAKMLYAPQVCAYTQAADASGVGGLCDIAAASE